jgi:undecaprenyl-diphosphatase
MVAESLSPAASVPARAYQSDGHEASVLARAKHGFGQMVRHVGPPFFIGIFFVTAISSIVGLLLTNVIEHSSIVRFDVWLEDTLEANRTATLDKLTGIGTFLADPIPVAFVWLLAVIVTAVIFRHWRPPLFFMVAIGGEKLSYLLSTLVVDRPRPEVETVGKVHVTSSYPSGHVGSAISLWAGLALLICAVLACRLDKRAVITATLVGLFFALEVGYSRLYRGHHFFTDVVMGAVIGTTWVVLSYRFVLAPYLRERRERLMS